MTTAKERSIQRATALGLSTALLICDSSAAAPKKFDFYGVEFMPREERVPAAKKFLDRHVKPGMPIGAAIDVVSKAGTACGPAPAHGGVVQCSTHSVQRHPGLAVQDVTWQVRIDVAPDGTVVGATVTRTTTGA